MKERFRTAGGDVDVKENVGGTKNFVLTGWLTTNPTAI
jgi:hypothetical protein